MISIQEAQSNPLFFDKFISENLRLVHYLVKKYDCAGEYDDYFQCGSIGLIKAAKTFKCEKGFKFATYASRIINNEIQTYYRKKKKHLYEISLESPLSEDINGNELTLIDLIESSENIEMNYLDKTESKDKFSDLLPRLSGKYRSILKMYMDGTPRCDIGEKFGLSQSYISRIIGKIQKLGHQIDHEYQTGEKVNLMRLGRKETNTMEEIRLNKAVAETLLKGGKSPDEIAEEYKDQFSGQSRVIKALLAKWGLVEKKVKPEKPAKEEGVKNAEERGRKLREDELVVPVTKESLLRAEVMAGKEYKYEMGDRLTIKRGEDKLPCTFEGLPRLIKELQEIQRMKQEAV